ncbi:MAG TPA: DUF2255 family protein [Acidimicrobiia bacterium]|nr:DUF2255 family protein [Acidimicrobiia bacterium]
MSAWTPEGLETIGAGAELEVAPSRPDGTPGPSTTIWVVRIGDELYVRSYRGRNGRWFRHAIQQRQGRIRSGGIERDVTFEEPVDADRQAIDAAYRSKYARYGATYVDAMVGESAAAATLRLVPR